MEEQFRKINQLTDAQGIRELVRNIASDIVKDNKNLKKTVIVGIRTRGALIAEEIVREIKRITGFELSSGTLDITLYRDDVGYKDTFPEVKATELPFLTEEGLKGLTVILIDDVLYTGRTIRAAMDALMDFGRPDRIKLGVLVDRGHRELPIAANYVGIAVKTKLKDSVRVLLQESDGEEKLIHKEK